MLTLTLGTNIHLSLLQFLGITTTIECEKCDYLSTAFNVLWIFQLHYLFYFIF